eukprot:1157270-Pelagomonas_calceolata.AAC.1
MEDACAKVKDGALHSEDIQDMKVNVLEDVHGEWTRALTRGVRSERKQVLPLLATNTRITKSSHNYKTQEVAVGHRELMHQILSKKERKKERLRLPSPAACIKERSPVLKGWAPKTEIALLQLDML